MSDKKIKFRTAVGGYKKEDVNGYIESISNDFYEKETELKKKIADLEKKVAKLEEESEDFENELKHLQDKYNDKYAVEREEYDGLVKENGENNLRIKELEARIALLTSENDSLKNELDEAKNKSTADSEVYEKSTKYDQLSGHIGSMIVNANAKAESIVSEAELKARITSNAMIDTTVQKLNAINDKYSSEIMTKTVQLTDELRTLSLTAESFRTNTKKAIEKECNELKETLECTKRVIMEDNNE